MPAPKHELERLYVEDGLTTREIGERYGVAHITVMRWLRKYGIPVRPPGRGLANRGTTAPSKCELHRLVHVEGMTYARVAELYGVDKSAVPQWLDRYGLPRSSRKPPITPAEAARRYAAGESAETIAHDAGYKSKTSILKMLRDAGVNRRREGWNQGPQPVSSCGCPVRSTYEVRVADWLTAHGASFEYEPDLPFGHGNLRGDFFTNGWYIEVWGVHSVPSYLKKKAWKQEMYAAYNLPLIELSPHHFARDKHIMERRLRQVLKAPENASH